MSWPIGRARSDIRYVTSPAGEVSADGVPVTDAEGWLDVNLPREVEARGLPQAIAVRIRVGAPGHVSSHIFVEDVRAGDRTFGGLHHFAEAGGLDWIAHLIDAVCAELRRRSTGAITQPDGSVTPPINRRLPSGCARG